MANAESNGAEAASRAPKRLPRWAWFAALLVFTAPGVGGYLLITAARRGDGLTNEQRERIAVLRGQVDSIVRDATASGDSASSVGPELHGGEVNSPTDTGPLIGDIRGTLDRIMDTAPAEEESGVPPDSILPADQHFRMKAESGDTTAMVAYAVLSLNGNREDPQYEEAARWLQRAAELGNPDAGGHLGEYYMKGLGVPRDDAKAYSYIKTSADAGSPIGMAMMGLLYQEGVGVAKSLRLARDWYQKAAPPGASGEPWVMYNLGNFCRDGAIEAPDLDCAHNWYMKAADAGHPGAMNTLGVMYRQGQGVPQDDALAADWFTKAAIKGDPDGMCNLATLLRQGKGVEKNTQLAIEWYMTAADLGHIESMRQLAELYTTGADGAPKDPSLAEQWQLRATQVEKGAGQ